MLPKQQQIIKIYIVTNNCMNLRDQAIQIKYPETDLDVQITYYSTYKNTLIRDRVIHEFHHFVCFCQTEIKNKPKEQFAIIPFFKKKEAKFDRFLATYSIQEFYLFCLSKCK